MAHATTDSNLDIDVRLANLKKTLLPGQPFRLTAQDDPINVRRNGVCKQCGYRGDDPCYCHAHHTFISRAEMSTFSDDPEPPTSRKTTSINPPDTMSNGKKISLDAYKSRLKAASSSSKSTASGVSSKSVVEVSEAAALHAGVISPASNKRNAESISTNSNHSAREKYAEASDRPTKKLKASPNPTTSSSQLKKPAQRSPAHTKPVSTASEKASRARSPITKKASTSRRERERGRDRERDRDRDRDRSPPARDSHGHGRDSPVSSQRDRDRDRDRRELSPQHSQRSSMARRSPGGKSPIKHRSPNVSAVVSNAKTNTKRDVQGSKSRYLERERTDISEEGEEEDYNFELPAFMSPLPDEINRAVEEWERQAKKGERDDHSSTEQSSVSQKYPLKRPPAAKKGPSKTKSRDTEEDGNPNRLLVTLRYGSKYSKKVLKILRTEIGDGGGKERITAQTRNSEDPSHTDRLKPQNKLDHGHQSPRLSSQSFKSPAIKVSSFKGEVSTPNRKGSSKPRNSDVAMQDASGGLDTDAIKADSESFLALGIKLKHATDKALGMKDSDEFNLLKGAVYAAHCIISYLLAFGLEDELRRREKKASSSEGWKAVVNYIEVLLTSRLKANPHIHGLLYQLGAVCTERVLLLDQQRLLSIPLSNDNSASPSSTTQAQSSDMFRKVRSDVVRTMRTNREWWFLGHQRLGYSAVQESYKNAWAKRSPSVIRRVDVNVGAYLVPYYLPLFSGSTPLEAASFAWRVTQEWSNNNHVDLNTGLTMRAE